MEKTIRVVDEARQIVQVTTLDERWYAFQEKSSAGLPVWVFEPSVTFITHYYPKGAGYEKWLADKGYTQAEIIKTEAGDRGTIVHHACEKLITTGVLDMKEKIKDRDGNEREMTPDEYYCAINFRDWYIAAGRPPVRKIGDVLGVEYTVRSKKYGYAGTLDYLFQVGDELHLYDLKTSKDVYTSHELQLAALKQALSENGLEVNKTFILQVGYTRNKTQHYKVTEVNTDFSLFLSTKSIWANENNGVKPFQRDYPLSITINENTDAKV